MELRDLPSVDVLADEIGAESTLPRAVVLAIARRAVDESRQRLTDGAESVDPSSIGRDAVAEIEAARPTGVINATGVLLHTNLGRAPLDGGAAAASSDIATSASNVEIDIRTGRRSKRHTYVGALLPAVSGAEAGFAVNNNAGALLLALASLAGPGGKVAVSRGELIEIGGSFRLPALMKASGVDLVEVGTTNRTRLTDFRAVAPDVDALLKVHPSNYRIDGFQEEASYADLAELAGANGIPFIADVGSGLIDERAPWLGDADRRWLADEPGVIQTVSAGADLTLFSGDKLLGGPQAGILVGRAASIERAMTHPIARAVRLDGSGIAALASTLEHYANGTVLDLPFWRMASASPDEIAQRASAIADRLGSDVTVVDAQSVPGAGSVPGATIPTSAIRIDGSADDVWLALAAATPPVVATRRAGAVFIDLRSVPPHNDVDVAAAIEAATS